jgi:hypothetical protein
LIWARSARARSRRFSWAAMADSISFRLATRVVTARISVTQPIITYGHDLIGEPWS